MLFCYAFRQNCHTMVTVRAKCNLTRQVLAMKLLELCTGSGIIGEMRGERYGKIRI